MPSLHPSGPPGDPRATNQAHVQAQGAWFTVPELAFGADLLNLDATLVDRTPEDPLTPLVPGSYDVHVHAGEVRVHPSQVRDALYKLAGGTLRRHGLSRVEVGFLPGGRVRVSGSAKRLGIDWPVKLDFQLVRRDANTLAVVPQLNAVTRWVLERAGIDLAREIAGVAPGTRREPGGGVAVDLRRLPYIHSQLQEVLTQDGRLRVRLGAPGATGPAVGPQQGANHWVRIEARGEVAIPDGNLRNGRVLVRGTPGLDAPIYLNAIPKHVTVRRETGEVILTRDSIVTALQERVPDLALKEVRFEGQTLRLEGVYRVPGGVVSGMLGLFLGGMAGFVAGASAGQDAKALEISVRETIHVALTPEGNLRLTPSADSMHAETIRDELARLVGARRDGEGVVLDFSKLGELEVGAIKRLRVEQGKLVLGF